MEHANTKYIMAITSTTQEDAEQIARIFVEEKLVACVQIMGPVTSFYWWKGEILKDAEAVLILKTKKNCITKIKERLKSIHPYEIPELLFFPIVDGLPQYLHWIDSIVDNKKIT